MAGPGPSTGYSPGAEQETSPLTVSSDSGPSRPTPLPSKMQRVSDASGRAKAFASSSGGEKGTSRAPSPGGDSKSNAVVDSRKGGNGDSGTNTASRKGEEGEVLVVDPETAPIPISDDDKCGTTVIGSTHSSSSVMRARKFLLQKKAASAHAEADAANAKAGAAHAEADAENAKAGAARAAADAANATAGAAEAAAKAAAAEQELAEAEYEEELAAFATRSQSSSHGTRIIVPLQDTAAYNVGRLQESLRGQLVPATYDTLEEDIGEVLDREEKSASRGTAESEEKTASKGTSRSSRSVHFDSPDGQAEQLPVPSRPAVVCTPPATWETSPGVTVDWNWRWLSHQSNC